jgi:hypothetical protein
MYNDDTNTVRAMGAARRKVFTLGPAVLAALHVEGHAHAARKSLLDRAAAIHHSSRALEHGAAIGRGLVVVKRRIVAPERESKEIKAVIINET